MELEDLKQNGIDIEDGLKRFMGNRQLYKRCLAGFLTDENYVEFVKSASAGDWAKAFEHAHALKGLSGNLSMKELYSTFCELSEKLRPKTAVEIKDLAEKAEADYKAIVEAIKSLD